MKFFEIKKYLCYRFPGISGFYSPRPDLDTEYFCAYDMYANGDFSHPIDVVYFDGIARDTEIVRIFNVFLFGRLILSYSNTYES